jgi:hypothetical protein
LRVALALLVLVGACTPDFDDVTTIKDLRVLGVAADTPELLFDGGPMSMAPTLCVDLPTLQALDAELGMHLPQSFPTVTLRPMVADPAGMGRAVHFRAVACVSPAGTLNPEMMGMGPGGVRSTIGRGECPADAPVIGEGDATPAAGSVLAPIEIQLAPTAPLVVGAFLADPLGAVYGLPLTVEITVSAGGEQAITRKRILIAARLTADQMPNQNPVITQLNFRHTEDDALAPFDLQNPRGNPPQVHLGGKLRIEPVAGTKEMYPTRVGDRTGGCTSIQPETEALRYAFYATAGTFSPDATNTEPPIFRSPGPDLHRLESVYQAPKELLPGQSDIVRVWIVNRDERAGASIVEVALQLIP